VVASQFSGGGVDPCLRLSSGTCSGRLALALPARPIWFQLEKLENRRLTPCPVFVRITTLLTETMYAVIETGGKQYRVAAGDTLDVERLDAEAGKPFTFERVLLIENEGKLTVGRPTVAQARIVADVIEHLRGEKKVAFKLKRRKGYRKTIGHRQSLTRVKISEIKV